MSDDARIVDEDQRKDVITDWYWDMSESKHVRWEVFKWARSRSLSFKGVHGKMDRFNHYGEPGPLFTKLSEQFRDIDDPRWQVYSSVQHVQHTAKVTKKQLKQLLDKYGSHEQIAYELKTRPEIVGDWKDKLEDPETHVPDKFKIHANLGGKDFSDTFVNDTLHDDYRSFQDSFWNHFLYTPISYDLVVDIDVEHHDQWSDNIQEAYEAAHKVKDVLDSLDTPFQVKFSGGKGFHFTVPRDKLAQYSKIINKHLDDTGFETVGKCFKAFLEHEAFDIDPGSSESSPIDDIYQTKRVYRVPYTVHASTGLVALPLTDAEFQKFSASLCRPSRVASSYNIRNRSTVIRQRKANVFLQKFLSFVNDHDLSTITDTEGGSDNDGDTRHRSEVDKLAERIENMPDEQREQLIDKIT